MSNTLLPCPFCGGEAIVVKTAKCGRYIACWDCGCRTEEFETDYAGTARDKAITAWTRRALHSLDAASRAAGGGRMRMNRLTTIGDDGYVYRSNCTISDADAWKRLAAYEDTGLTPEEILDHEEMFKAYRHVCGGKSPEEIAEALGLLQEKQEGRQETGGKA